MSQSSSVPAREPPAGQTSNLVDPPSLGYQQTITNAICISFVVVFVALRIYTRARLVKCVSIDDYLIILAACLFCADAGLFQHMTSLGMGRHLWNVSASEFSPGFLATWTFAAMLYSVTMLCIKMSILMLYRRLFPINNFKILWWACVFCTVGYSVAAVFSSLFARLPIRANWDMSIRPTHRIDKKAFYIGNGVMNIATDLMILALPMPIVWKLTLELRQKIILSIVFTLGSISCIISLVRLLSIITWIRVGDSDITYTLQSIIVWSTIELAMCIVCANAPCLRPFFQHHLHFLTSFLSSATGGHSSRELSHKPPTTIGRKRSRGISTVFDGGNAMEMGRCGGSGSRGPSGGNKTMVSVTTGGESDEESSKGIVGRKESLKGKKGQRVVEEEEEEDWGIMVHSSFRVHTVSEGV